MSKQYLDQRVREVLNQRLNKGSKFFCSVGYLVIGKLISGSSHDRISLDYIKAFCPKMAKAITDYPGEFKALLDGEVVNSRAFSPVSTEACFKLEVQRFKGLVTIFDTVKHELKDWNPELDLSMLPRDCPDIESGGNPLYPAIKAEKAIAVQVEQAAFSQAISHILCIEINLGKYLQNVEIIDQILYDIETAITVSPDGKVLARLKLCISQDPELFVKSVKSRVANCRKRFNGKSGYYRHGVIFRDEAKRLLKTQGHLLSEQYKRDLKKGIDAGRKELARTETYELIEHWTPLSLWACRSPVEVRNVIEDLGLMSAIFRNTSATKKESKRKIKRVQLENKLILRG